MKRAALFSVFLLCAKMFGADESAYSYDTRLANISYQCSVNAADLKNTPDWPDTQANPPLSPRAAIRAAIDYANLLLSRGRPSTAKDGWEVLSVALRPTFASKWIYSVDLVPPLRPDQQGLGGRRDTVKIVVFMDGRAAPLIISSPSPEK